MAVYGEIAGGGEEGSMMMKLSAVKRQASSLDLTEPQTCEEANRRRGIGIIEGRGVAESEYEGR